MSYRGTTDKERPSALRRVGVVVGTLVAGAIVAAVKGWAPW